MPNTDLTELDLDTVGNIPEKGTRKDLYMAHQIASEKHDLDYFKTMLREYQESIQAEAEEKAAKKAAKGKRKSKGPVEADHSGDVEMGDATNEVEVENDEDGKAKSKAKKRKKDADSDGETTKVSFSQTRITQLPFLLT
jgi:hypothetical protein